MDPHTAAGKGLGLELKVLSFVSTTTIDTRAYLDFTKLLPRATPERGRGEKTQVEIDHLGNIPGIYGYPPSEFLFVPTASLLKSGMCLRARWARWLP